MARLAMLKDSRAMLDLLRTHLEAPATGSAIWANFSGVAGDDHGVGGTAELVRHEVSGTLGVDVALDPDAVIGVAGGYSSTKGSIAARISGIKIESWSLSGYAASTLGALHVRSAVSYSWTGNRITRTVSFPGFGASTRADYDGNVLSGFGEIAWSLPALGGTVEPFAAFEGYRVWTDDFVESGGAVALAGTRRREDFQLGTLGLRAETPVVEGLSARAARLAAWLWRSRAARQPALRRRRSALHGAGRGAVARCRAGLDRHRLGRGAGARVSAGYSGLIGESGSESAFRATVSIGF